VTPHVSRLRVYPVKSCRGYDVERATLDDLGMVGDRRYQVVDPTGKPFTQRSHPIMAQVSTQLDSAGLRISAPTVGELNLPLTPPLDPRAIVTTEVWSTTGLQADANHPEADAFFSTLLGTPARLVHAGDHFDRPVKNHPDARVGFADGFPLLVIGDASLQDLNDRLAEQGEEPVAMERFRPNLVITDCAPFDEDRWQRIRINQAVFASAGPCERCVMTTLHPTTGERLGPEPLRTLNTYRRTDDGVLFGQNLVNESKSGPIAVGDDVMVLA
jgi:uncharacterized protein